jgi:hypothetical protein
MKIEKCVLIVAAAIMLLFPSCMLMPNHPPIITSLKAEPEAVLLSASCQIECIASDEDGDELSYEWLTSKSDIEGNGPTVTWNAPDSEGIYNVVVKVTDGNGGEAMDYVGITVRVNNPPIITSLIADVDWVTPSSSCRIECDAEDPDGDELGYEWSTNGGDISGTGPVVTWTAPEVVGLYHIQVVVTDGRGEKDTSSLTVSVALNTPPVIEDLIVTAEHKYFKKESERYLIGKETSCQIECLASAPGGGELSYGWSASGGELSGEGSTVTWTAPNTAGEITVTVTVSDTIDNMVTKSIVLKVVACSPCTFG